MSKYINNYTKLEQQHFFFITVTLSVLFDSSMCAGERNSLPINTKLQPITQATDKPHPHLLPFQTVVSGCWPLAFNTLLMPSPLIWLTFLTSNPTITGDEVFPMPGPPKYGASVSKSRRSEGTKRSAYCASSVRGSKFLYNNKVFIETLCTLLVPISLIP